MMPLISTAQFNELGVGNQFRIELRKEAYFVVPDDDQLVSVGLFSEPLVKGHELLCVPLLLMSPQCNSTSPAGRQLDRACTCCVCDSVSLTTTTRIVLSFPPHSKAGVLKASRLS